MGVYVSYTQNNIQLFAKVFVYTHKFYHIYIYIYSPIYRYQCIGLERYIHCKLEWFVQIMFTWAYISSSSYPLYILEIVYMRFMKEVEKENNFWENKIYPLTKLLHK